MGIKSTTSVAAYEALMQGIRDNTPAKSTIVLRGETFTPATLTARIQARVDAAEATTTARSQHRAAVKAERAAEEDVRPLRVAYRAVLVGQLGADSETLTKYGFTPAKPRNVSSATKATAAAQGVATRKARNPYTKADKKKIKGVVPVEAAPAAATEVQAAPATSTAQSPAPAQNGAARS